MFEQSGPVANYLGPNWHLRPSPEQRSALSGHTGLGTRRSAGHQDAHDRRRRRDNTLRAPLVDGFLGIAIVVSWFAVAVMLLAPMRRGRRRGSLRFGDRACDRRLGTRAATTGPGRTWDGDLGRGSCGTRCRSRIVHPLAQPESVPGAEARIWLSSASVPWSCHWPSSGTPGVGRALSRRPASISHHRSTSRARTARNYSSTLTLLLRMEVPAESESFIRLSISAIGDQTRS